MLNGTLSTLHDEIVEVLEKTIDKIGANGTTFSLPVPVQPDGIKWTKVITEEGPCFSGFQGMVVLAWLQFPKLPSNRSIKKAKAIL